MNTYNFNLTLRLYFSLSCFFFFNTFSGSEKLVFNCPQHISLFCSINLYICSRKTIFHRNFLHVPTCPMAPHPWILGCQDILILPILMSCFECFFGCFLNAYQNPAVVGIISGCLSFDYISVNYL